MKQTILAVALAAAAFGCSSSDSKPWPELHPVKGTVKLGGQTPSGGYISFISEDAANADFIVSGKIESDGSFKLATTHALEKNSAQKSGAPAGRYKVRFMPPATGDQVTGSSVDPIDAVKPATVTAGNNDIAIELPKPKK